MEDCQTQSQVLEVALTQHSLSMLGSILEATRIQWFPSSLIWENGQTKLLTHSPLSLKALQEKCEAVITDAEN